MVSNRVLVVEDDPDSQEMVATLLQHMSFDVTTADTGEDATTSLVDSPDPFDAIIIDLALPGMDGWELLEAIQGHPDFSHLPCIAVTAFHTSKLREDALRAGFTAYFPKPIDGTQLGRELDRLIA